MRHISKAIALAALALSCASCDSVIYDYDDKCQEGLELRFVYDYNMEWADAFPAKVHCLTVLVYDQNGCLVTRRDDSSQALRNPDYRMAIDLPEGRYHVVAYGGMACDDASFSFDADPATLPAADRSVSLTRFASDADGRYADTLLHDQFFGALDIDVAEADFNYTSATVEMMKNTNNFRILLQQVDEKPLKGADFDLIIVDDNTRFAADNAIIPSDAPFRYLPWAVGESSVGTNSLGEDWTVAHFDISTSRLITRGESRSAATPAGASSVESPRLLVKNHNNGETIADLPLVKYLLLLKGEHYAAVGNQEFLDRQSDWNIVLFLNSEMQWINTHIVVNDWVVRINDTEL